MRSRQGSSSGSGPTAISYTVSIVINGDAETMCFRTAAVQQVQRSSCKYGDDVGCSLGEEHGGDS